MSAFAPVPKHSLERMMLVLTAALGIGLLSIISYLGWTMFAPYEFFTTPKVWPISNHEVKPGDDVWAHVEFCKHTDLPATIGRQLVGRANDGRTMLVILPTVGGQFEKECGKVDVSVAQLPQNIPAGTYKVLVSIVYHLSFVRDVNHRYETDVFTVR